MDKHDLTFPCVPTHAALTVVFCAMRAPFTIHGCGQQKWSSRKNGSWFPLLKSFLCSSITETKILNLFRLPFLIHYALDFRCSISERLGKVVHTRSINAERQSFPRFSGGSVIKICWELEKQLWSRRCAVLAETVATVTLSAAPTITCSEQLAHSRTAGMILKAWHPPVSEYRISIINPSFDTDRYTPPALCWHVKKAASPTKWQIPAS